jgi:hypothetical protein
MNAIKIDAGFKAVSQASLKIDILPSYTLHIRGPMRSTTGRVGRWLQWVGSQRSLAGHRLACHTPSPTQEKKR